MAVVVCPRIPHSGSGTLSLSCQGWCLLMGSLWVPAQDRGLKGSYTLLPRGSPHRMPSTKALPPHLLLHFDTAPKGPPNSRAPSLRNLRGLCCNCIRLLPSPASLIVLRAVSLPEISASNSASHVTQPEKGTDDKYNNKSCQWYWLHTL